MKFRKDILECLKKNLSIKKFCSYRVRSSVNRLRDFGQVLIATF